MADFISGQDLVARGVEGTGAAVVLDNRPTIQSLARLGGRMDNLYKTQEMLKLKLAAAKAEEAKPPKQPNINPFATGGIAGEYLGSVGNQFMQSIAAIKKSKYNQKLGSNDIVGANQEAADAASALATLNPTVQNLDLVMKKNMAQNENYYQFTGDVIQKIQSQFPTINGEELSKISDPIEQEKYIMNKYNKFLQSDANTIVNNATLLNPESYNYNGVFKVINENLKDRAIDVRQASGRENATNTSELFVIDDKKGTVALDYNKAINAVNQLPKAKAQVEVLQKLAIDKAVKETKDDPAFVAFTAEEKKNKLEEAATKAATKAERQYYKPQKIKQKKKQKELA